MGTQPIAAFDWGGIVGFLCLAALVAAWLIIGGGNGPGTGGMPGDGGMGN